MTRQVSQIYHLDPKRIVFFWDASTESLFVSYKNEVNVDSYFLQAAFYNNFSASQNCVGGSEVGCGPGAVGPRFGIARIM